MVLVFVLARRRVGPVGAALLVVPIVAFGPGWEVIIFPFGLSFLSSTLAALVAMLALDRRDRTGDVLASILLDARGGRLELRHTARRGRGRRDPVAPRSLPPDLDRRGAGRALRALVPRLQHRDGARLPIDVGACRFRRPRRDGRAERPVRDPPRRRDQATGIHGLLEPAAHVVASLALGALVWRVRRLGQVTPRLAMLVTTLLSYWVLTGLARGAPRSGTPAATSTPPRSCSSCSSPSSPRRTARAPHAAGVAVVALGAGLLNAGWLIKDGRARRTFTRPLAAELAVAEIMRDELAVDAPWTPGVRGASGSASTSR